MAQCINNHFNVFIRFELSQRKLKMHIHDTIKGILAMKLIIDLWEKLFVLTMFSCFSLVFISECIVREWNQRSFITYLKVQVWSNIFVKPILYAKLCQFLHLFNIQSTVENSIKNLKSYTWTNTKDRQLTCSNKIETLKHNYTHCFVFIFIFSYSIGCVFMVFNIHYN